MFWLLAAAEEGATEHAAEGAHHAEHVEPIVAQFVNRYLGESAHHFQITYTKPKWDAFFAKFGTSAEAVFGPYTPENAIPWYTIMFIIACVLTVAFVWIFRGKLSEDDPSNTQQTLEAGILTVRQMLVDVVGEHSMKYFPVVATFACLILVSNLMGMFPLFMAPTAHTSVTFALGISSFVYYNFIGIKENGIGKHLAHLAGPIWWMAPLIFLIELISNFIRPMSLGIRLFGNMFADEQVAHTIANLAPPYTQILVPIALMPLALFVAFIQTFVFTLLSMVYLSEVSHPPHHAGHHDTEHHEKDDFAEPLVTA